MIHFRTACCISHLSQHCPLGPTPLSAPCAPAQGSWASFRQSLLTDHNFQASAWASPPLQPKIRANCIVASARRLCGFLTAHGCSPLLLLMQYNHSCFFQLQVLICIKLVGLLRASDHPPTCTCQARTPLPFSIPSSLLLVLVSLPAPSPWALLLPPPQGLTMGERPYTTEPLTWGDRWRLT